MTNRIDFQPKDAEKLDPIPGLKLHGLHATGSVDAIAAAARVLGRAIDCPKCLAAWDAFAADTGATVEVIPTPAEQGDDEPWGAGAADRGGRW